MWPSLLAIATEIPLSWTSPMYPKLYSTDKDVNPLDKPITENEDAWIGSLVTIGAAFGPIPFGYLTQKLGSKIGLLAISVPFIVSSFALAFTNSIYVIYVCRVVAGLSVGGSYTVLNFYLAEVSQDHNRGRFSQATNICWSLGNFISYSVGPFVSYRTFNILNACIPTIFFVLFLVLAPESPYFLATNGNIEKTTKSLMLLRSADKEGVQEELQHIRNQVCKKEDDAKLCELFSNGALRRAFIICCVLVAVQELSGVCVITFYMQPIFESANTKLSAEHSTLIASFSILASSFVNPFFVDRAGRRILLVVSLFGTGISLITLGGFFYISESTNISTKPIFWLPLVSLIMYTFAFSFGISSIPSTLVSEIFPNNVKQACVTIIAFLGWGVSFLLTRYYNCLRSALGAAGSFWIFAVCCLFGAIFCLFCVPETKGKSINEIQHILQSQSLFRYGFSKVTNNNDPKKKPFSNEIHINNGFI